MARPCSRDRRAKVCGLVRRDGATCWLCGQPIDLGLPRDHDEAASLDHIVPSSMGGGNDLANLKLAHQDCNSSRGDPVRIAPGESKRLEDCTAEELADAVALVTEPIIGRMLERAGGPAILARRAAMRLCESERRLVAYWYLYGLVRRELNRPDFAPVERSVESIEAVA